MTLCATAMSVIPCPIYPPVNIQKTMEHHHVQREKPLFLWPFSIAFCMFTRGYHHAHMLPVWNIYQHLPHKWPSFVGKYTSTMEHMGCPIYHRKRPDDAVLSWIHHFPLPRMGVRIPRRVQILQTDLAKLGEDGPATGAQKGHLVYDYTKSMRFLSFFDT
jgi:hypothetical protein